MAERTEGEEWARAELERLMARRWSPPAVAAFLAASQRRAAEVRAARPDLARQARRWTAAGGLAAAAQPRPRAALTWWAACAVMLDWHLGMVETEDGVPRPLGPADAVTLARAWAVPLAWDDPTPALLLAAWASDGLDGVLARRSAPTRAGRDLEGLVDACLLVAALRGLRRDDRLSRAAVSGEALRQCAGVAYAVAAYLRSGVAPDSGVMRAGRASTPLRVAGLVAAAAGSRTLGGVLVLAGSSSGVHTLHRTLDMRPRRLTRRR